MQNVFFEEVFSFPIQEFKSHLERKSNERIVFSGKYGIGKTNFLANFFNENTQASILGSDYYDVYRLFPINYSIASNEDIIRYIKYDIIIEMLKKTVTVDEIKLRLIDTLPTYVFKELHKVTAALVYMIPKLGKEVVECFEKIDKLKEEYLEFHDKANKTDSDKLVEYLENLELKEGSIYENDITTKIITKVLSSRKRESILLIDDIDRLDPEHVFRILNVFASHFDSNSLSLTKNKFNFDKIIIVCDFNNIKNIFHHRYGTEVDFMGYIDKFYSSDVYHFDNRPAIIDILEKIFSSIEFKAIDQSSYANYQQLYFHNEFISGFITSLVENRFMTLRTIMKYYKCQIGIHHESITFDSLAKFQSWKVPILLQLKFIKNLFGDFDSMQKITLKLSNNSFFMNFLSQYFNDFIYILSFIHHNFRSKSDFLFTYRKMDFVIALNEDFNSRRIKSVSLYKWTGKLNSNDIPERGDDYYAVENMELVYSAFADVLKLSNEIGFLK